MSESETVAVGPASANSARPSRSDVREEAIAELAVDCAKWDMDGDPTPACIEGWRKALARCSLYDNGYDLARELDSYHGVSPDAELVEILDGASLYLWSAHDRAVAAWVTQFDVKPALRVGTRIQCRYGEGVISGINAKSGRYIFVPEGEEAKFARGGGVLVEYEDAQAIEARRAETQGGSVEDESAVPKGCAQPPGDHP